MNRTPINKLSLTSLIGLCSDIFCSTVQARRSHRVKAPLHLRLNIVCFLATICLFTASTAHSLSAQELNASDAAFDDLFGTSVSLSGNIGLVGAENDDENGNFSGSAYVFRNLDNATGTINESVKLIASDGAAQDRFGGAVSLSGNIGLIGAERDDDNGFSSGSAYVFRNLDTAIGTINESVKLTASDGSVNANFGGAVSLSGNIGLIGADNANTNLAASGSAYIFRNLDTATGNINESVRLIASDAFTSDQFGTSVSLSGNMGLIGADRNDDNGTDSGSAYIFRDLDTATGTINESVKLTASDAAAFDEFGGAVSLSGNIGLIGAQLANTDNGFNSGSAYVFRNLDTATGTINESVKLIGSDTTGGDDFGISVSLSGDIGLIGAESDDDNGSTSGSAYIFRNLDTATGTINESVKLIASDGTSFDRFGGSVSLDGDRFTIGAERGNGVTAGTGSAYTGTVSSLTTLDVGNSSAIIDGISFESRTDWIIGEFTSGNMVTLTADDSASIVETGMFVLIGANAGSNDNILVVEGSIEATDVFIGANFNVGNELVLSATAESMIETLTLLENNFLTLEGELTSFSLLDSELGTTELFLSFGNSTELITAANFDSLLLTTFNSDTGFTTFTSVPEPSAAAMLMVTLAGMKLRRKRRDG